MTSNSTIDWDDAKRRVSELARSLSQTETFTESQAQEILRARAERLARAATPVQPEDDGIEVMIIRLGDECHALESTFIREVIRVTHLTPLPGTADHFLGIMNLRGRPLLIVDGRILMGLRATETTDDARIIVVGHTQAEFGLLADGCEEVVRIPLADIGASPQSLPETTRRFIHGVTDDATIILDTERLKTDPKLWIDEPEV